MYILSSNMYTNCIINALLRLSSLVGVTIQCSLLEASISCSPSPVGIRSIIMSEVHSDTVLCIGGALMLDFGPLIK